MLKSKSKRKKLGKTNDPTQNQSLPKKKKATMMKDLVFFFKDRHFGCHDLLCQVFLQVL